MSVHVDTAIAELTAKRSAIEEGLAQAIQLIRSAQVALEVGDRMEAARLVTAAADMECQLTGYCEAVGALEEPLGLTAECEQLETARRKAQFGEGR